MSAFAAAGPRLVGLVLFVSALSACSGNSGGPDASYFSVDGGGADLRAFGRPDANLDPPPDLFGADLYSAADLRVVDLGASPDLRRAPDLASAPDLSVGMGCTSNADCRLFSNYCDNNPCACLALPNGAPSPICPPRHDVACLIDPCVNSVAICDNTGTCVAR